MKMTFALIAAMTFATQVDASPVSTTSPVTVTSYYAHTGLPNVGNEDVAFLVNVPIAGCAGGLWLRPTDPGFKAPFATVMMAYMTKVSVHIWADDQQLWPGSSSQFCRVVAIRPM